MSPPNPSSPGLSTRSMSRSLAPGSDADEAGLSQIGPQLARYFHREVFCVGPDFVRGTTPDAHGCDRGMGEWELESSRSERYPVVGADAADGGRPIEDLWRCGAVEEVDEAGIPIGICQHPVLNTPAAMTLTPRRVAQAADHRGPTDLAASSVQPPTPRPPNRSRRNRPEARNGSCRRSPLRYDRPPASTARAAE